MSSLKSDKMRSSLAKGGLCFGLQSASFSLLCNLHAFSEAMVASTMLMFPWLLSILGKVLCFWTYIGFADMCLCCTQVDLQMCHTMI